MEALRRILHIEDNRDDAALILRALKKGGLQVEMKRVETSGELKEALGDGPWDIVLSDYALPSFDGLAALKIIVAQAPDLPFILVSGAVGEETAVKIMKAGAKDYIMKDQLGRLVPAIEREFIEAKLRREKRSVENQRNKLEEQLWQAQKMEAIGTLAGGIAHDFNNILTAIIGYSELAERELETLPDTRRKVGEVIKAGNRAKELVQHILTFSRQKEQERKPLEIHLIINEALKLLRASTPSTIEFRQSISKDCGNVFANPSQIHQVVMNLCTNAYHAMTERGGTLTVSLAPARLSRGELKGEDNPPGEYVHLSVRDTGAGIPPAIIDKIFNPYFTTKAQGVGTGLGLSLVLGIVKSHAGFLTVRTDMGKGTVFDIYFPRSQEDLGLAAVTGGEEVLPRGTENLLVVDDEMIIVQFSKEILEGLGYQVTAVQHSLEALNIFKSQPDKFAMVITDMTMPKMTGTQLSQELLKIRPDLPIILCTGHSDMVNSEIAGEIGIREYRVKPISGVELAHLIRKHLD